MDSFLITLAIMAISALASWMQKRKQEKDDWWNQPNQPTSTVNRPIPRPSARPQPPGPPPNLPNSPPPVQIDWEREVRRLFGQEEPASQEPPRRPHVAAPQPPPTLAPKTPRPSRPAVQTTRRAPVLDAPILEDQATPTLSTGTLKESTAAYDRARQLQDVTTARMRQVDSQPEATAAFGKGLSLRAIVNARMRGIDDRMAQPISTKVAGRRTYKAMGGGVRSMIRQPEQLRTALLASTILGPPKSLSES